MSAVAARHDHGHLVQPTPGAGRHLGRLRRRPVRTLIAAYAQGSMVGFGYAFPCTLEYVYGPELLSEIPQHIRTGRLMGLCELAVTPARQSQGIGSRLHAELVKAIDPDYASLLVRPDNTAGPTLYNRFGYTYAGP
ncbi:GNAT family N-acetyltransferase [Streptomyces sp. NPDC003006]